jgi:hypothetical protein
VDRFLDIYDLSLKKKGEELCGDTFKALRTPCKTIVVLSDGLGSGVKANILATMTTEIILTLLSQEIPLEEVIKTIIGTLPVCKIRKIAYSTFTIVEINNQDFTFSVSNFDNPPILYFRRGKLFTPEKQQQKILNKTITRWEGKLETGDFLGMMSDGVLYAGMGKVHNFGWGWENISKFMEGLFITQRPMARDLVYQVISKTHSLYSGEIGDDATFAGIYVRPRTALMIFTGPPMNKAMDDYYVNQLLQFPGRKVVCGGTTANIVSRVTGNPVETDISSMRRDVPPIGRMDKLDLLTEGILTISKALEYLRSSQCDISRLPVDNNGAVLFSRELLNADYIYFLVGQRMNEFYQNPRLPETISIRKNLIKELADLLQERNKEVVVEYC